MAGSAVVEALFVAAVIVTVGHILLLMYMGREMVVLNDKTLYADVVQEVSAFGC